MTDRIDLDELTGTDAEETGEGTPGDWLWREEGGAAPENEGTHGEQPGGTGRTADGDAGSDPSSADAGADVGTSADAGSDPRPTAGDAVPHVPRSNRDRPAGVLESSGGAGAGSRAGGSADREEESTDAGAAAGKRAGRDTLGETGPHGGGIDDVTVAFSYRAARRLANPGAAVADASSWADWIGIVGDVPAYAINKFQREHAVDADFFNGSGTGPGERLAEIGPHSMFYAERMVLVGVPGEDEAVAERADWEFVPLSEASEKADWELEDPNRE